MTGQGWALVVVAVVGVVALYLRGLIGRLDRLHLRVEAARETLDAQLLRRARAVTELAALGRLDLASTVLLVEAADTAQEADDVDREIAESALSEDLRAVLDAPGAVAALLADPAGRERLAAVATAVERVTMARRFHNDAVRAARALRGTTLVRVLHLAGHAGLPASFEMDDAPPAALSRITWAAN